MFEQSLLFVSQLYEGGSEGVKSDSEEWGVTSEENESEEWIVLHNNAVSSGSSRLRISFPQQCSPQALFNPRDVDQQHSLHHTLTSCELPLKVRQNTSTAMKKAMKKAAAPAAPAMKKKAMKAMKKWGVVSASLVAQSIKDQLWRTEPPAHFQAGTTRVIGCASGLLLFYPTTKKWNSKDSTCLCAFFWCMTLWVQSGSMVDILGACHGLVLKFCLGNSRTIQVAWDWVDKTDPNFMVSFIYWTSWLSR